MAGRSGIKIKEEERVLNKNLIKRIVARISAAPLEWDQGYWVEVVDSSLCKTKRCFAGWAMFLEGYVDEVGTPTVKGWQFFKEHSLSGHISFYGTNSKNGMPDWSLPYEEAAAIVLGISASVADQLFDSFVAECTVRDKEGYSQWVKNDLKTFKREITRLTGIKDFRVRTKTAA